MTRCVTTGLISLLVFVSTVHSIEVNVSDRWREELGWEVTCDWDTLASDTLQSVRLYKNYDQFFIYRPERHGSSFSETIPTTQSLLHIDCAITEDKGRQGFCKMLLELDQPDVKDFTYTCEVSGERPLFRIGKKDYVVRLLVPPSKAQLRSNTVHDGSKSHVTLNCSSAGLPAPTIQWSVQPDTKLEANSSGRQWNSTSKLWQVWSSVNTRESDVKVLCTPEVTSNSEVFKGEAAQYNSAISHLGTKTIIVMALLLSLLR